MTISSVINPSGIVSVDDIHDQAEVLAYIHSQFVGKCCTHNLIRHVVYQPYAGPLFVLHLGNNYFF